jgi:hypothetical protein
MEVDTHFVHFTASALSQTSEERQQTMSSVGDALQVLSHEGRQQILTRQEEAKKARHQQRVQIKQDLVTLLRKTINTTIPEHARTMGATHSRLIVALFYVAGAIGNSNGYEYTESAKTVPALRQETYRDARKLVAEVVSEWKMVDGASDISIASFAKEADDGGYAGVGARRYMVGFKLDWGRGPMNCIACTVQ